ncbi:MAG: MBL fold metallo-hydrolase [Anaerolinea sp.]|nr:MBL fold metallo-hydrolase [Anaerolinea sp.]
MIRIKRFTLGLVETNAYLIGDTNTGLAVIIDPVDDAPRLHRAAQEQGWRIALILATHAHFDHVLASKALKALTDAPFRLHRAEQVWLDSLPDQGLRWFSRPFPEAAQADSYIEDGEVIQIGAISLLALLTPGHSPGHLAFLCAEEKIVFSGDALFAGSIGRTDLPLADHAQLIRSIQTRLLSLDDSVRVLPGHGPETTIGQERRSNPWLR